MKVTGCLAAKQALKSGVTLKQYQIGTFRLCLTRFRVKLV